ncbi:MAG: glutamate-5-semialdehyde dehydrogenase [Dehalococcoidales bacterium]|nr:glutamate-5-semialdehyde dehydrogenase [Dehalococcoidales bacterium]
MSDATHELEAKGHAAKEASRTLAYISAGIKNAALKNISDDLKARKDEILAANEKDCSAARESGMDAAMLDRLVLNSERLDGMASDVMQVAAISDPVGEMSECRTLANGLIIGRKRVPLGVIGTIYESRPNVTVDISALCIKSGNAVLLRGGREAVHSNTALAKLVADAAERAGMPRGTIQFIENNDRALVEYMLKMNNIIDLFIPRGGAGLIKYVRENASMPVVAGGIGVCHTYIDHAAKLDDAVAIAFNAKVQRPTVCNAMDTLIVHKDIAADYLPKAAAELAKAGVEMHCDNRALNILKADSSLKVQPAVEDDWGKEYLALIMAIKVVDSLDEAIDHIAVYGSGHSEAIVTEDYTNAQRFLNEVDAACVYVNASTRFTDGAQFGLGAEVGISTQKIHARGPLGVKELTTYKWIIYGSGHVRP